METKTKNGFKAVDYMWQVHNELSTSIQTHNKRFHDELKQAMGDFIAKRQKTSGQPDIAKSGADE